MRLLLTGGTGQIGSAVLHALVADGHDVLATVRRSDAAAAVESAGARPILGDLSDRTWLRHHLDPTDGMVHTAAPASGAAELDTAIVETVVATYGGSGRPYLHTGGIWSWGNNLAITEASMLRPPALTAWRTAVEEQVLHADGIRGVVISPGIVHGRGRGLPGLITGAPRPADGALVTLGSGDQHWTTVHADDLAELYRLVLLRPEARGRFIGAADHQPRVGDLTAAAPGVHTVVEESVAATRERLGADFADALLLDQRADARRARQLGWRPTGPTLLEEIRDGSYLVAAA